MKKAVFAVVFFMLGTVFAVNMLIKHIYPRSGTVTELLYDTNEVIWDDDCGHWWSIKGIDDWEVGDGITVVNFDCFTPTIEDDITVVYRYN